MTELRTSGSHQQPVIGSEVIRQSNTQGRVRGQGLVVRRRAPVKGFKPVGDAGLATAEYAIAMIAAAGFAGLLITVLKSSAVRDMLTSIVKSALSI